MFSNSSIPGIILTTSKSANKTTANSIQNNFRNLAKALNLHPIALFFIFVISGVALFIIVNVIVRKCRQNQVKTGQARKGPKRSLGNIFENFEKYESRYGYIDLTIMYDKTKKILRIQNLSLGNIENIGQDIPDCYIQIFMINNDGKRVQNKKTKTINDNPCPYFTEIFILKVEDLLKDEIHFRVYDENLNGNDYPLGDGKLVLRQLPQEDFIGFNYPTFVILTEPTEVLGCGEVCIVITYTFPKLNICILEVQGLLFNYADKDSQSSDLPSVYAVVKVFIKKNKKKTFKSKSVSHTRNPYFCETFSINMSLVDLGLSTIKVEMFEFIAGKLPKRIGRLCLGNKSFNPLINDLGQEHMELVKKHFKFPQAMWHALIRG